MAESIDIPIVLYNIPGRTGSNILPETIARIAKNARLVAVKEATGSMDQASSIAALCDVTLLSGDDSLTLPLLSLGGRGVRVRLAAIIADSGLVRILSTHFDGLGWFTHLGR